MARLLQPDFPEPIGVIRAVQAPTFEEGVRHQITEATQKKGKGDLQKLLASGDTWRVPSRTT